MREGKAARDWRCRHHQDIDRLPLRAQLHPLRNAKPVLFVDHCKAKVVEGHVFLEHCMGADEDPNLTRGQRRKFRGAVRPFVAPSQYLDPDTSRRREPLKPSIVLPREDFGRRHHHSLPTCLDRPQEGHQRHQRFSGPYVALQKPVHPRLGGHIA